jgi:hypothetical protein
MKIKKVNYVWVLFILDPNGNTEHFISVEAPACSTLDEAENWRDSKENHSHLKYIIRKFKREK